jgi:hypothetical protein
MLSKEKGQGGAKPAKAQRDALRKRRDPSRSEALKSSHPASRLDAALAYAAERGWEIFPADSDGKKKSHKAGKNSNGKNWGMTKDPDEIKSDFKKWPRANIGIPTGAVNRIWVLEADTKEGHDVDGIAALRELEAKHGPLPETLMAESPSGSIHYYFKWPTGINVGNSTSKIAPGVDVRGEGGMVIAPPSIRADGAYRWLNEGTPIPDAPPWLIELATKGDAPRAPTVENNEPVPDYLLGIGPVGISTDPSDLYSREADIAKVAAAMAVIPNNDVSQQEYNTIGMACWAATGGSDAGFELFDQWARKSEKKYHGGTVERWRNYTKYPPPRSALARSSIGRTRPTRIGGIEFRRRLRSRHAMNRPPTLDQGLRKNRRRASSRLRRSSGSIQSRYRSGSGSIGHTTSASFFLWCSLAAARVRVPFSSLRRWRWSPASRC